jgi:PLP dependent protein
VTYSIKCRLFFDLCNMSITTNLEGFKSQIEERVTLVAVSKRKPVEDIREAYDFGQRDFGENHVQEMCEKQPLFPDDMRWHFIGHLQSNKVKYIAPFIHLIHGVDSLKLLKEISKRAIGSARVIDCLLQIKISEEETKYGLDEDEIDGLLGLEEFISLKGVRIVGLMGMASNSNDDQLVRQEFDQLQLLFSRLKRSIQAPHKMEFLSMGMSGDFPLALSAGSNMIRVGSGIFGARNN